MLTHTHMIEIQHTHTANPADTKLVVCCCYFWGGKLKIKLMKMVINLLELLFHEHKKSFEFKSIFCLQFFMLCVFVSMYMCYLEGRYLSGFYASKIKKNIIIIYIN